MSLPGRSLSCRNSHMSSAFFVSSCCSSSLSCFKLEIISVICWFRLRSANSNARSFSSSLSSSSALQTHKKITNKNNVMFCSPDGMKTCELVPVFFVVVSVAELHRSACSVVPAVQLPPPSTSVSGSIDPSHPTCCPCWG